MPCKKLEFSAYGKGRSAGMKIIVHLQYPWFLETDMIKKVSGGYRVLSEKGKNLGGPYKTKKEAEKRLKQVEFFKHKN